jgi:hypothetical protein
MQAIIGRRQHSIVIIMVIIERSARCLSLNLLLKNPGDPAEERCVCDILPLEYNVSISLLFWGALCKPAGPLGSRLGALHTVMPRWAVPTSC